MYATQTQQKLSLATRMVESWKESKADFILGASLYAMVATMVVLFVLMVAGMLLHVGGIHEGSVIGKSHVPESISLQCNSYDGKTTICTNTTYPETWNVKIEKDGDKNSFSIPKDKWDTINKGDYLVFDGEQLETVKAQ